MANNLPEQIDMAAFTSLVLEQKARALVCFLSEWSAPCREMLPVAGQISDAFYGEVQTFMADPDTAPLLAASCEIVSIPTFVLYLEGHEVGRIVGVRTYDEVERMILRQLGAKSAE